MKWCEAPRTSLSGDAELFMTLELPLHYRPIALTIQTQDAGDQDNPAGRWARCRKKLHLTQHRREEDNAGLWNAHGLSR